MLAGCAAGSVIYAFDVTDPYKVRLDAHISGAGAANLTAREAFERGGSELGDWSLENLVFDPTSRQLYASGALSGTVAIYQTAGWPTCEESDPAVAADESRLKLSRKTLEKMPSSNGHPYTFQVVVTKGKETSASSKMDVWLNRDTFAPYVTMNSPSGTQQEELIIINRYNEPPFDGHGSGVAYNKLVVNGACQRNDANLHEKIILKWSVDPPLPFEILTVPGEFGIARETLVVRDGRYFVQGVKYVVNLYCETSLNHSSVSTLHFLVNTAPTGPSCTACLLSRQPGGCAQPQPPVGLALIDTYRVSCLNWVDSESPLQYQFGYSIMGEGSKSMNFEWSGSSSLALVLPPGEVVVRSRVRDRHGGMTAWMHVAHLSVESKDLAKTMNVSTIREMLGDTDLLPHQERMQRLAALALAVDSSALDSSMLDGGDAVKFVSIATHALWDFLQLFSYKDFMLPNFFCEFISIANIIGLEGGSITLVQSFYRTLHWLLTLQKHTTLPIECSAQALELATKVVRKDSCIGPNATFCNDAKAIAACYKEDISSNILQSDTCLELLRPHMTKVPECSAGATAVCKSALFRSCDIAHPFSRHPAVVSMIYEQLLGHILPSQGLNISYSVPSLVAPVQPLGGHHMENFTISVDKYWTHGEASFGNEAFELPVPRSVCQSDSPAEKQRSTFVRFAVPHEMNEKLAISSVVTFVRGVHFYPPAINGISPISPLATFNIYGERNVPLEVPLMSHSVSITLPLNISRLCESETKRYTGEYRCLSWHDSTNAFRADGCRTLSEIGVDFVRCECDDPSSVVVEPVLLPKLGLCTACPAGTYESAPCSDEISRICRGCPNGKYRSTVGAKAISDCIDCSAGKYSNQAATSCQSCSRGTYAIKVGSGSVNDCIACVEGKFSVFLGSNSESSCGVCSSGKYQNESGQTFCRDCERGKYGGGNGFDGIRK